ncbi:MAG: hypothetical protein WCK70_04950 [Chloroflexales bacterium]
MYNEGSLLPARATALLGAAVEGHAMIRLAPTFITTVAQAEIPIVQLAREAGVAESTIHALLNPDQHPHRKGGMHRATAWKLANAFARRAQVSPQEAYQSLIVEEDL